MLKFRAKAEKPDMQFLQHTYDPETQSGSTDLDLPYGNINSSPSSSNGSEQFDDCNYNPQSWLLSREDTETWLNQCSPMESPKSDHSPAIKEEPPSPPKSNISEILSALVDDNSPSEIISKPINASKAEVSEVAMQSHLSYTAKSKRHISNPTLSKTNDIKKINSHDTLKLLQKTFLQENPKALRPACSQSTATTFPNKLKSIEPKKNIIIQNVKPTFSCSGGVLVASTDIKPTVSSFPTTAMAPKVVKLENGQYYVPPSITTPVNKHQVSMSKPLLKRPASINIENLLAEAKNFAELKNLKRQQRMMKNRESACLSRQRKKQHLQNLEECVAEMTEMNKKLKDENEALKQRISLLEYENKELREQPSKPLKVNAKKTTLLLAVLLIFAFHSFRSNDDQSLQKHLGSFSKPYIHRGRSLLQFDNSNINNYESLMEQEYQYDAARDVFNTDKTKEILRMMRRNKLKKFNEEKFPSFDVNNDIDSDCGGQYNQSHLTRINKDLEGLANGFHKGKNKSRKKKSLNNLAVLNSTHVRESEHNCSQTDKKSLRRHLTTASYVKFVRSPEKLKKPFPQQRLPRNGIMNSGHQRSADSNSNSSQELANLIQKSIIRKPDTFYVVSLLQDMLILPATNFSSKQPPKVTFMLPAYLPNSNNDTHMHDADKVPIIQIDCNVLDTKLLRIQGSSLPKHLLTELKG